MRSSASGLGAGSSYEHLTYELHLSCTDTPRPLVFGRLDVKKLASQTVSSHQARTAKVYPFIKPIAQRRTCDNWHLVASGLVCARSASAFTSLCPSFPSVSIMILEPWVSATAAMALMSCAYSASRLIVPRETLYCDASLSAVSPNEGSN